MPVLFAEGRVVRGSWDIVSFANHQSLDCPLGDMSVIAEWDRRSEAALAEGRTRVVRAVMNNEAALEEALPQFIPRTLRRPLRFLAKNAARRLDQKYAHLNKPGAIRKALELTRQSLEQSSSDFLLGAFSYADITMAAVLEVVAPIANTQPPLGPETQRCWNDLGLAREFEDLVQWRNRLARDSATSYSQFKMSEVG